VVDEKEYIEKLGMVARISFMGEEDDVGTSRAETNPIKADGYCEDMLKRLLDCYSDVLCEQPVCTEIVQIGIDVGNASPIAQCPYRISEVVKGKVKEEIARLSEAGIIVPSTSLWSFSLVPVRKPDNIVMICVDFWK